MKRLPFSDRPYRNAKRPHLKWQVVGHLDGKRPRKFFETQGEAKAFAHLRNTELAQHGCEAMQLSTYERLVAKRCRDQLATLGLTIEDVTRWALEKEKARRQSCAIEIVFDQFIESLAIQKLTKHYINQFRRISKRIGRRFPGRLISDFSTRDLEQFLTDEGPNWSGSSRNQHRRELVTVWSYAKKHGYCSDEAAKNITCVKEVVEKPVGILRPDQLAKLLAIAPPKLLPGLAIGAFAGLRVSEICRLDWGEIDLEARLIRIAASKTKSARHRDVQILPCLAAWLRPFEKTSGRVAQMDVPYFDELRQAAATKAGIISWPGNALRHSFASYHIAHFKDAKALSLEMGHTTTYLIYAHYRALVRPALAAEYWQIAPFARPELATIYAFTPEAYPWCHRVCNVVKGDWIDGVKNLAHYFGVDYRLPYYWFNEVPDCPPRPTDDRFHIPAWVAFVRNHKEWRSSEYDCGLLHYASWYCNSGNEMRKYFVTEDKAAAYANERNRALLAKELRLEEIQNVIEFNPGKSLPADTVQSPIPPRTSENAGSAG